MKDINKTTKLKNNLIHSYFYIYISIIDYLIYNKKCPNKKGKILPNTEKFYFINLCVLS